MDIVLFESDWERFRVYADFNTKNETFLKLAHLYRDELKVKNWKFHLALMQPELSGVDPFADNLDRVTKAKIAYECKYNPWYYFREVARVPISGPVPSPFLANRGNIALYWSFFNHINFGLLQPRQTGKSVSTDILMVGLMFIWGFKTEINLITKDARLRDANIRRLKGMRDLLPDYIDMIDRNDVDNNEALSCIRLGNRYGTSVARNDVIAADKLGRGLTVPIMQFDEFAYISLIGTSLPVALAAGSAARRIARANRQFFGNIFTTTAGDITTRDGKFAHRFMTGGAVWTEAYLDLKDQATLELIIEKGTSGETPLIYGAFNHRQLGFDDMWLYKTLRESASSGEIADRDFFNIWTVGGEGSPLLDHHKKILKEAMSEPMANISDENGYLLRWYIPEHMIADRMARCKVVMGCDPSELLGAGNDSTGIVGIDTETHEVLFTGRYNETSVPILASFIANLLIKYENITWVPERKSTGISLIDMVILVLHSKGICPFRRIFNRVVDESNILETEYEILRTTPVSQRTPQFYDRFKRHFGFNTSGGGRYSRNALFKDSLSNSIDVGGRVMNDNQLITELLGLVIKNGRIDHDTDKHDDMVVSMLLAHWTCIRGQNLDYYGINPKTIFVKARTRDVEPTNVEVFRDNQNAKYRAEFDDLIVRLKGEPNRMLATKLEMRLRAISRWIDVDEAHGMGIDAMIQQVHDERVRRVRSNRFGDSSRNAPARFTGQRAIV
ncbi:terminase large subunit [Pseudomonas phage 201phi2-1]|uniref:Terminase large subunit n=1 Tax=Pseudomonas phage 201phi2-1 TaxID=198110 RepID=B3FJY1_BP201|nr:terminase large subunit [Pseudomonas phage 201phi2-1]ABY62839.1 terminase large subunit [Pseudomonas phage 201phi2-1]